MGEKYDALSRKDKKVIDRKVHELTLQNGLNASGQDSARESLADPDIIARLREEQLTSPASRFGNSDFGLG